MKKIIVSFVSMLLTVMFMMSFSVVFADSQEILLNPGFENDIEGWGSAVNCTNVSMKSYSGVTPRTGEFFVYSDNRYGVADSPMQLVTGQMNFYKSGTYRMSGSFRLPSSASMSTTTAKVVIRLVSSDKSYGSAQYPGINWYTSAEVNVSKTSWAHVSTDVPMEWPENTLVSAEFYYLTDIAGTAMDMCFDDASLIKVGYSGNPYVFPTISVTPRPTRTPTATPTTGASSSISQNVSSSLIPTTPIQSSSNSQPVSSSVSGGYSNNTSSSSSSEQTGSGISNASSGNGNSNTSSSSISSDGSVSQNDSQNSSSSVSVIVPGTNDKGSGPVSPAGYVLISLVSLLVLGAGAMLFYNLKARKSPDTKLPSGNGNFSMFLRKILSGENPAIYSSIAIIAAGVVFISLFLLIPAIAGNNPASSITSSDSVISGGDSGNLSSSQASQAQSASSESGSLSSSAQSTLSIIMSGISGYSSKATSSQIPTNIVYPPAPTTAPAMLQKIAARDKMFVTPPSEYRVIDLLPGIRLPVTEMASKNMGGALVSVNWGDDYLNNDLSWYALNQDLTKLANAKMTAWIWDEKGFPSGSAGGQAVEGRPDLESRGVFKVSISGEGTGHREISLPSDSEKFLSAVLYPVVNGSIQFDKGTPAVFTDTKASTNGMNGKWELWVATESILLEGGGSPEEAGAQFKTSGRYPNLMSRDAVRRLIDVSYKKYQSKVENFSDRIYAFLAGEPNLQVIYAYTNNPRKNGRAYFAWEKSIPSIYRQKYGSDLIPVLPLMLGGEQEVNKRVRYQYYTIVGDLVSQNFSGQITEYSESVGSKASAYLFGQESMSLHVWLYGNYMQVVGKYSIPAGEIGIASHENFSNLDFSGMKYITSAARMNGKYKSMIYMDPLMGGYTGTIKIGSDVLIRNMNMEAHYGFNMFGTYGHYNTSTPENYSKYNTYAGRLGVMLQDAVDKSQTAIFYPIETFQGRSVPTKEHYYNVTTPYADIETVQNDLVNALSGQSIDYNFIDANAILKAPIKNKAMVIGKNNYKVIIMPAVELIDFAVIQKLNTFEAAGGKVIYYQKRPSIATKSSQNAALKSAVANKMIATSMVQIIPLIKNTVSDNVTIDATTMVVYSQYVKDSRQLVFIVNTLGMDGKVTINIGGAKKARIINPDTGSIDNVTLPHTMDIGSYKGMFVEVTG